MEFIIPEPKSGTTPIYKKLQLGNKPVLLTIFENNDFYNLYFGSKRIFCLQIQITKEDSIFTRFNSADTAILHKIQYNELCSLENKFMRGQDTNLLLRTALSYITTLAPYVKRLKFKDASTRECDNGSIINLSQMSYILYGRTWYEKNFSAFLNDYDTKEFQKQYSLFTNIKNQITWDMMTSIINVDIPDYIETIYNSTNNWQDFFSQIRDIMGISDFCSFISPWLDSFLTMYFKWNFFNKDYYMPVINYEPIQISDYNIQGGKRMTYKRRKQRAKDLR